MDALLFAIEAAEEYERKRKIFNYSLATTEPPFPPGLVSPDPGCIYIVNPIKDLSGAFHCTACNATFRDETFWHLHMQIAHPFLVFEVVLVNPEELSKILNLLIVHEPTARQFRCGVCNSTGRVFATLYRHVSKVHQALFCLGCEYVPHDDIDRTRHIEEKHCDEREMFRCSRCPWSSVNYRTWTMHMRKHIVGSPTAVAAAPKGKRGRKPLQHRCIGCNFKSQKPDALDEHIEVAHKDGTLYSCPRCHLMTQDLLVWMSHVEMHRRGKRIF